MKKSILYIAALSIIGGAALTSEKPVVAPPTDNLSGSISISGAFALYPLAVKWGEEFKKLHPNVKFDISAGGAGKGISDALAGMVDLGAVSRDIYPEETEKGCLACCRCRGRRGGNGECNESKHQRNTCKGLKKRSPCTYIYATGTYKTWKQAGFSVNAPIHVYTRSDAAGAAETWAKYFGKNQEDLQGVGVFGDPWIVAGHRKRIRSESGIITLPMCMIQR